MDAAAARLPQSLRSNVQRHGLMLARTAGRLSPKSLQSRLGETRRRLAEVQARNVRALKLILAHRRERLQAESKLFSSLNYRSVLARGFAVVRDASGKALPLAVHVKPGTKLKLEFSDGTVDATANAPSKQGTLF
jgi:exodeoxyribonuclease VII large subunit